MDLDTQMKIDTLLDYAYDNTIERINAVEDASETSIYRTLMVINCDMISYLNGFSNYYNGVLEGILFTRFLEVFQRMPTPSENAFIVDSIEKKI
ncbi:MAG: hypothetical protein OER82_05315 [Nitrosopumilus sp.]|nr:hypothetical protein [Nitrosopumilus sp.]